MTNLQNLAFNAEVTGKLLGIVIDNYLKQKTIFDVSRDEVKNHFDFRRSGSDTPSEPGSPASSGRERTGSSPAPLCRPYSFEELHNPHITKAHIVSGALSSCRKIEEIAQRGAGSIRQFHNHLLSMGQLLFYMLDKRQKLNPKQYSNTFNFIHDSLKSNCQLPDQANQNIKPKVCFAVRSEHELCMLLTDLLNIIDDNEGSENLGFDSFSLDWSDQACQMDLPTIEVDIREVTFEQAQNKIARPMDFKVAKNSFEANILKTGDSSFFAQQLKVLENTLHVFIDNYPYDIDFSKLDDFSLHSTHRVLVPRNLKWLKNSLQNKDEQGCFEAVDAMLRQPYKLFKQQLSQQDIDDCKQIYDRYWKTAPQIEFFPASDPILQKISKIESIFKETERLESKNDEQLSP